MTLIAAVSKNGVIGKEGKLPWSIPEELAHFKQMTVGKTVIMGRKTFESIGGPLPFRKNIVLSRTKPLLNGVMVCHDIDGALAEADFDAFVIGGAEIFRQMIWVVDRMLISHIDQDYEGDMVFPRISPDWKIVGEDRRNGFVVKEYAKSDD